MEIFNQLHQDLKKTYHLRDPRERRNIVIKEMEIFEAKGIHCQNCPGTCCTSVANSMHVTPLETLEILLNLKTLLSDENKLNDFIDHLKKTIQLYRLDKEIYTGKKNQASLRKRYTCPFFNFGKPGCALSRGNKPYGCLGFNAQQENDNGQTCRSDSSILAAREHTFLEEEKLANTHLKKRWNIDWEKKSIPEALLEVISKSDQST